MTDHIPSTDLDDPLTSATWPYLYFISYAHPQGFGHHHVRLDQPATSSKAAGKFAELISVGTGTPREDIAVLGFQLLSGPENNRDAEDALRDLLRMVDQFDTPRDPGRVQAFVGDVRQVALRGLGHTRG